MDQHPIKTGNLNVYLGSHRKEWIRGTILSFLTFVPLYRWCVFHEESWTLFMQFAVPWNLILATVLSSIVRRVDWAGGVGILTGIAFGVIVDVAYDDLILGGSRNLFPFEVAMVWGIVIIPVFVGLFVGYWFGRSFNQQAPPA